MRTQAALLAVLTALSGPLLAAPATSDSWDDSGDDWGDSWEDTQPSPWKVSGFIEGGYGSRLHNDRAINRRTTLKEVRGRVNLDYIQDSWTVNFAGDAIYDDVLKKGRLKARELALSFSPVNNLDIKAGRQILTWGTGDYLFINDLFPKDWQSFFAGRDDEYLKAPSDALRSSWFPRLGGKDVTVDLVWNPRFRSDRIIRGERFSYFNPMTGQQDGRRLRTDKPAGDTWAARLATSHRGVEYALYGNSGYWPVPRGSNLQGKPTHHRLDTYGASARMPLGRGLFNMETAFYNSRDDRSGKNPRVPNSQLRWLMGYEQELAPNLTAAAQYYLEWTQDYRRLKQNSPKPEFEQKQKRHLLTLRLTWRTLQQKLTWSLFSFWSPSDRDGYLKPSVSYRLDDHWTLASGANMFFGKQRHSFFGQHKNNSNAWLRARFNF